MRMLAAASTIPVTKAAKQKNSKSSLRIVVMYPCASAPIGWGRLGPRPGRVCLVLLTPPTKGAGRPFVTRLRRTTIGCGEVTVSPGRPFDRPP